MKQGGCKPMEHCKYCSSDKGYYVKYTYKGNGIVRLNFDGSPADNEDMYDCLTAVQSKYAYCLNCDKRLFKTEDILWN